MYYVGVWLRMCLLDSRGCWSCRWWRKAEWDVLVVWRQI